MSIVCKLWPRIFGGQSANFSNPVNPVNPVKTLSFVLLSLLGDLEIWSLIVEFKFESGVSLVPRHYSLIDPVRCVVL